MNEVGGLLQEASINTKGLMPAGKYKQSGRYIVSNGYIKIAVSNNWYTHYAAILFATSPSSEEGCMIAVDWYGTQAKKTGIVGSSSKIKLYSGTNNDGFHELWIGLLGETGSFKELVTNANCFSTDLISEDVLPDYLSEI